MNVDAINGLPIDALKKQLFNCCGSDAWVNKMVSFFPIKNVESLLSIAQQQWYNCTSTDWLQAFTHHPKIGDVAALTKKFAATATWASGEQQAVNAAPASIILALADGNTVYQNKFGFIFIVCATGKSAQQMLTLLQQRLPNTMEVEMQNAMEEQNKITQLRLQKLLA
jgi:2-oxo-4-hydroxy-4-carboxy-5-ureidoimidazoline decarboxylase